jgi:hypothetical protein
VEINDYVDFSRLNRKPDGKDTNHLGAKNLACTHKHTKTKKRMFPLKIIPLSLQDTHNTKNQAMTNFPKIPQTVSDRNTNRQTMMSIETNAVQKLLGCGDSGESSHFPAQNSLTPSIVQESPCCSPEKATANDCASESSEHPLDADERLARSRDRNREHARRTRLRKKQQLEALQKRVKELQEESRLLKQTIEECSIASILLGLSSGDASGSDDDFDLQDIESIMSSSAQDKTFFTITGKRKRFVSDADLYLPPMKLKIKGKLTMIGGNNCKAQINWKTGVYHDEDGKQQQLTHDELEELR